MGIYIFGFHISILHASLAGLALGALALIVILVLDSAHDNAHGEHGVRHALFMHGLQDKRSDDSERSSEED